MPFILQNWLPSIGNAEPSRLGKSLELKPRQPNIV
jgi:hypothetical protein